MSKGSMADKNNEETRALLIRAKDLLGQHLDRIETGGELKDTGINSVSLIVRTLEKIDGLTNLLNEQITEEQEFLEKTQLETLRAKVIEIIEQAVEREKQQ